MKRGKKMLQGKNLNFIRAEKNEGVGRESGLPYCFCNLTLSDGMESFKLDMKPEIFANMSNFKKGDTVNIEIDVVEKFKRTQFIVTNVQGALQKV